MEASATADIVANQADYDVPADFSVLRSLKYNGFRLKVMSFAEFNEYVDGFTAPTGIAPYGPGVPEIFMVWNQKITVFPKPQASLTGGLNIYYIKHPAPVATLADALSVPLQYHNAVVKMVLQQAYMLDEDPTKAQMMDGAAKQDLQKLQDRNKWTAQEYYPRITVLPQDETWGDWGGYA
jgi:hypothetical protein